jgi:phage FluMu protein Com
MSQGPGEHGSSAAGEVFTVVVAGPGRLRWGVVVRASGEEEARASAERRGHQVLAVRAGATPGAAATRVLGACIRCGYSLARLPAGAAGEVMCPECGIINVPTAPLEARLGVLQRQRRLLRLVTYALVGALVMIVVVAVLLSR